MPNPDTERKHSTKNTVMIFIFLNRKQCFYQPNQAPSHHIAHYRLRFAKPPPLPQAKHCSCHLQITNRSSWREPLHRSQVPKGSGRGQHQTLKWFETVSKGGAEFASEPDIDRASIFNGMEKKKGRKKDEKGGRSSSVASSSVIPLKGQDFVGGFGKSSELQMHRTAGYFPLPWPAKESSFKTHLPVNILAWLWVIPPVSTRPIRAWRCTCTNPETDLVTSDFPSGPTTSCLIVSLIHPVAGSLILRGFLTSFPLRFLSFLTPTKPKTTFFWITSS